MKATEAKLLGLLRKSPQFVIPIYQRTYSWTVEECRQLWDDVLRAGQDDAISVHFIGSIVYIEAGLSSVMAQAPLLVIDGQQRLTTLSLLLAELAKAIGDAEPVDGFSQRKIRNYYLINPEESGEKRHKLILSQTDKTSLIALVNGHELPDPHSIRIAQNAVLFRELIAARKGDLLPLWRGMAKLVVVDIALDRDHDNPQLIFESMNSTGRELSQADLIRNFILMSLEPSLQSELYEQFWRPMELAFGQEAYTTQFDSFMRHYLTLKTREIPRIDEVYAAFKKHARTPATQAAGIQALVQDMRDYARFYCAMALDKEADADLKMAFHDLRELKVDVAYPFLLELYGDFKGGALSKDDFLVALRLIESYVFRRAICAIPTNSMNKTFANFAKNLSRQAYLESIQASFLTLPSYRRFPDDAEFQRDIKIRDLYGIRTRAYWLRRLENHKRRERISVANYTIEHILPQNENLSAAWKADLGAGWKEIQGKYLHTLGNLTLTGYNSEYSDHAFARKRDMEGGFKHSPLNVNAGLGELERWNEAAICERADRLAAKALEVWAAPKLPEATLLRYRTEKAPRPSYSIEQHPQLLRPNVAPLFAAFRKEVMALDPCVTEEFLRLYVAYKAETNFVDVIPSARRLTLVINMKFAEIDDPEGKCEDVTNLGRWGNGDVSVPFSSLEELPYILGLVRQSLDAQMGGGGEP